MWNVSIGDIYLYYISIVSHGRRMGGILLLSELLRVLCTFTLDHLLVCSQPKGKDTLVVKCNGYLCTMKLMGSYVLLHCRPFLNKSTTPCQPCTCVKLSVCGETYRQQLRTTVRKSDESNWEMATRVMELVQKWMAECTTGQEVLEMVGTE